MPTGMEGPKMTRREELRAEVKAGREESAEAGKKAQTLPGLLALVEQARAKQRENGTRTPTPSGVQVAENQPFTITPKMRAEAAARAEADRKRLPDN